MATFLKQTLKLIEVDLEMSKPLDYYYYYYNYEDYNNLAGVIQTAYANGSSTKYLTDVLVSYTCITLIVFTNIYMYMYSRTSVKGPSEKGTTSKTASPKVSFFSKVPLYTCILVQLLCCQQKY